MRKRKSKEQELMTPEEWLKQSSFKNVFKTKIQDTTVISMNSAYALMEAYALYVIRYSDLKEG